MWKQERKENEGREEGRDRSEEVGLEKPQEKQNLRKEQKKKMLYHLSLYGYRQTTESNEKAHRPPPTPTTPLTLSIQFDSQET